MVVTAGPTVDPTLFREVIGHFMTGVTVITTTDGGHDHGMSASAVASLSVDPPMLLACLNDSSVTQKAISRTRTFCVNVLAEGQHELALRFARPADDKFAGVTTHRGELGVPVLSEALAALQCRVQDDVVGGSHRVFLARVAHAEAHDGTPLAYFRGGFGRVQLAANARAHAALRELVVSRALPLDAPLDITALADRLALSRAHVFGGLLALEAEGLVTRDADHGFVLVAVDRAAAEQAFDARTAIELGVVDLTVGRVAPGRLAELRRRVDLTNGLIADGRFTDLPAYVATNADLHEYVVALADNPALSAAYRKLSIPALMIRLFTHHNHADDSLIDEHRALADAFEAGDVEAARSVVRAHSEHARLVNDAALVASGGRI